MSVQHTKSWKVLPATPWMEPVNNNTAGRRFKKLDAQTQERADFGIDSKNQSRRIGEARNPGPRNIHVSGERMTKTGIPADGICLFHDLGHHLLMTDEQVRAGLIENAAKLWKVMCPWDDGTQVRNKCNSPKIRNNGVMLTTSS